MSDSQSMNDAAANRDPEDLLAVLFIRIAETSYAIESGYVSRIVETFTVNPIPRTPALIEGVTDVGGEVTAVVDLSVMLNTERSSEKTSGPLVLLHRDGDNVGLRVDAVENYSSTDVAHIESVDRPQRPIEDTTPEEDGGENDNENPDGTTDTVDEETPHERSDRGADSESSAASTVSRWSRGIITPEGVPGDAPVGILDIPYLLEKVASEPEPRNP